MQLLHFMIVFLSLVRMLVPRLYESVRRIMLAGCGGRKDTRDRSANFVHRVVGRFCGSGQPSPRARPAEATALRKPAYIIGFSTVLWLSTFRASAQPLPARRRLAASPSVSLILPPPPLNNSGKLFPATCGSFVA